MEHNTDLTKSTDSELIHRRGRFICRSWSWEALQLLTPTCNPIRLSFFGPAFSVCANILFAAWFNANGSQWETFHWSESPIVTKCCSLLSAYHTLTDLSTDRELSIHLKYHWHGLSLQIIRNLPWSGLCILNCINNRIFSPFWTKFLYIKSLSAFVLVYTECKKKAKGDHLENVKWNAPAPCIRRFYVSI